MARVLIASPPVLHRVQHHDRGFMPFLGMGYLAGTLRANGHAVRVADSRLGRVDLDALLEIGREFQPDVVGLSAMTHEITQAYAAARALKGLLPACRIAVGGPHAAALPRRTLEECSALDLVCVGEGERTLVDAVEAWGRGGEGSTIAGALWRDGAGTIRDGGIRPWEQDLDALSFPAWDLFPAAHTYPIMSARGCPYRCNFCCRALGGKVRKRSAANVLAELEWLIDAFRPRIVRFEDETLSWDAEHIHAILDGILARGLHLRTTFNGQTRVDRADLELFRKLKAANFVTIEMGVESGSPRILAASGKHIDVDCVRESFAMAHAAGLRTWAKFIIGHPDETAASIRESIDLASALNPTLVSFAIMVPYPGTGVWDLASRGQGGYRLLSGDWSNFDKFLGNALELVHLPRTALERWQLRGYAVVYLRNRRFAEFAKLVWAHRESARALVGKLLASGLRPRRLAAHDAVAPQPAAPGAADTATVVNGRPLSGSVLDFMPATTSPGPNEFRAVRIDEGVSRGGVSAHPLTIDWEDWYQGLEFDCSGWGGFEDRLTSSTRVLLDILGAADTRATFFLIGRNVERHSDLVATLSRLGHEVAVHGYHHEFVYRQTPADFRAEIRRARECIERVTGVRPVGFRAPYFSITRSSAWALDVLEEEGFVYDSSVFPVMNYRYGIAGAPRWPHRAPTKGRRLIEIPVTTWRILGVNVPVGGAYFRLLPFSVTRAGIRSALNSGRPAAFYIHPWELDPGQPRLRLPARIAFTHYARLGATAGRLKRLLFDFPFAPIRDLLPSMTIDETTGLHAYAEPAPF